MAKSSAATKPKKMKRTIQRPPFPSSSGFTFEEARAAAYHVYRYRKTGQFIITKDHLTPRQVRAIAMEKSGRKVIRIKERSAAAEPTGSKR
jgi:hypothetical protein